MGARPTHQELQGSEELRPVAMFAVSSSMQGGESSKHTFPSGVTVLAPGHVAFVLATARMGSTKEGFQRFAFTTTGSLAVLHRCVNLPMGCVDSQRWELIADLRDALRRQLEAEPADAAEGWRGAGPVLGDTEARERQHLTPARLSCYRSPRPAYR